MLARRPIIHIALPFVALSLALSSPASAWGGRGHEMVAQAAAEAFSNALPAFLRTKAAREEIVILSRELDRSRGAGRVHDYERDPGHYFDIDENGLVGGIPLAQLPPYRDGLGLQLAVKGYGPNQFGYLPYAIIDGWQQLAKDFAQYRASLVGAKTAKTAADRAWFALDLKVREKTILRDIGVWGHYLGDGSQPLHVTEHHDGWPERYKDPMTYPPPGQPKEVRTVHNWYEGGFVRANISLAEVKAQMPALRDCHCPIEKRTWDYISATLAEVEPLYRLVAAGALQTPSPEAKAFTAKRLAAGAAELRDMIEDAWKMSATMQVGYPPVSVADIEAGKVAMTKDVYGFD